MGSTPTTSTTKEPKLNYNLGSLFKPKVWHVIAAQRAVYIIKGGEPPLYLITRQRVSPCGLMIYNACALIFFAKVWYNIFCNTIIEKDERLYVT